ncbi:hypothetical protein V8C42DRAFT_359261 [Trichoderma barbatum]
MTTVKKFLQPPPEELDHILVQISKKTSKNHESANCRHIPLAESTQEWLEFDVQVISSDPSIAACLEMPCEVMWEPQIPKIARVIYNERQLEALYLQTLITRVNIALDKAIPPEEDRIAIVIGPGAFESVFAEGTVQRLIPDWIVVQGTFDASMMTKLLSLKQLAKERKIIAVGDTKLIRQGAGTEPLPHTRACYRDFLRQLQEYCINLCTRFGFIISNEELVLTEALRAQEASSRSADERGLRSNGAHQLEPGLDDDAFERSDSPIPMDQDHDSLQIPGYTNSNQDDPYDPYDPYELPALSKPSTHRPFKRPHPSTSPETNPVYRYTNRSVLGSDASPSSSSYQMPSDPPASDDHQVSSDPPVSDEEALQGSSSQDHSKYTASVRDVDVETMQIRSFDMVRLGEDSICPYKILFTFIMMIRTLRLGGRSIEI